MAEMVVCLYGDVVTENIHEHHSSKTGLSTLGKKLSLFPHRS